MSYPQLYNSWRMKNYTKPKIKQSANGSPADLLDVYIRNNKKQALLVHIRPNTQIDNITRAISTRFRIPPESQILFHNGRTLTNKSANKLADKAIIHVVDARRITPEITINVRRLNVPSSEQFTISSSQIIEDFIVRNIRDEQPEKLFFVHTGRQLNRSRSFAEEFVESESQLFCLHEDKDQVKGEKREKYQKRIREQAAKKQSALKKTQSLIQFEETDSGLQSYLPKPKKGQEVEAQPVISLRALKEDTQPNFKKKNTTKQINLASNQLNVRQIPTPNDQNLSLITETNLQQSNKQHPHSAFFNEGSSISEIIPDQGNNPENNKRSEEGSMFQSAFIGLTYQNSFVNPNPAQNRVSSLTPLEEQDISDHSEKNSFSFDARAPELIQTLSPDRHLTQIQREILEVTESEQLSKENDIQNVPGEQIADQQLEDKQSLQKEREKSIENSQFQLGQIENHELSASAEMKVLFNEKQSPLRTPKNNQILIEDQENNEAERSQQVKKQFKLVPIRQDFKLEQEKSNHSACQDHQKQAKLDENVIRAEGEQEAKEQQDARKEQNAKQDEQFKEVEQGKQAQEERDAEEQDYEQEQEQEEKESLRQYQGYQTPGNRMQWCNTPQFQELPQRNIDIYFIQEENLNNQQSIHGEFQYILQQKNECQTNGPSSSSNFYSKSSSRVKQTQSYSNQYQFGDYHKPFNAAARRSGFEELKQPEDDDLLFEKSQSEKDNHERFQEQHRPQQLKKGQSSKQDQDLQIVELPLQIRIKDQSSLLLDQYSQAGNLCAVDVKCDKEAKDEKEAQNPKLFSKRDSKIEELKNLISELQQQKSKDNDQLLIQDSGLRIQHQPPFDVRAQNQNLFDLRVQNQSPFKSKPDSAIKIETSIRFNQTANKQEKQQSESSLQRVEMKKTVNSYQSDTNLFEHDMKQNIHKQNFSTGQFVFRSEPNYFQPLQFYISLFQKEMAAKTEPHK